MNVISLTEPPVEPVSLEEIYEHLRLDTDGSPPTHPQDALLSALIKSAREEVERKTRRMYVERQLRLVLPSFPLLRVLFAQSGMWESGDDYESRPSYIELLNPPLISLNRIQYYDLDNSLQTLSDTVYFVSDSLFVPRIEVKSGQVWPSTYKRGDAVLIDYTVGYPPQGSPAESYTVNIPETMKTAIKLIVQLNYDNLPPDDRVLMQTAIKSLLDGMKVHRF